MASPTIYAGQLAVQQIHVRKQLVFMAGDKLFLNAAIKTSAIRTYPECLGIGTTNSLRNLCI
jgi:hypothetical protein